MTVRGGMNNGAAEPNQNTGTLTVSLGKRTGKSGFSLYLLRNDPIAQSAVQIDTVMIPDKTMPTMGSVTNKRCAWFRKCDSGCFVDSFDTVKTVA